MGQVESVEENSTVTNTVDPEMLEKSREALYSLFAMNKDTFGDMCNNSTLLAQEMISHKTRLASNIQPFFGDDSCSLAIQGSAKPKQSVEWLNNLNNEYQFSNFIYSADFKYLAEKSLENENKNIQWHENFSVHGFPTALDLKNQVHASLKYFCDLKQTNESDIYSIDIPSDSACKIAFSLLFPKLRQFCEDFVIYDDISISENIPEGLSAEVEGVNHFHQLKVHYPINTNAFQKAYPSLYYAFSGISKLSAKILDETMGRVAITYNITPDVIIVECIISDNHLVWRDKDSNDILFNEDDNLDLFIFDLEKPYSLILELSGALKLINLGPSVNLPLLRLNVDYQPIVKENSICEPKFYLTINYIEQTDTEWLLSFILPIEKWKDQLIESFLVTLSLEESENNLYKFTMDAKVNTPRFPAPLKRILGIFGTEKWIEEALLLAYNSADAVSKDFNALFPNEENK